MELGRVAIVSLVELTIDFLLSIINAVLTTKQQRNTHTHGHTHTCTDLDFFFLWKMRFLGGGKAPRGRTQVKY